VRRALRVLSREVAEEVGGLDVVVVAEFVCGQTKKKVARGDDTGSRLPNLGIGLTFPSSTHP
jgi:hypothetical protein